MNTATHPDKSVLKQLPRERMAPDRTRFRIDLAALLDRHDMVWGKPAGPPADWRAGAPIGNGDFGAMVCGYPDAMSFVLGKTDVWNRRNDDRSQFVGRTFSEFRQTFFDDDEDAFNRMLEEANTSYCREAAHLTTCGRLRLHLDEAGQSDKSSHGAACTLRTHLREGQASLSWGSGQDAQAKAVTFVSHRFDVLCVTIERDDRWVEPREFDWELSRARLPGNPLPEMESADDGCFLTQRFTAGGGYTIGVAAIEGSCAADVCRGRLIGTLTPDEAGACSMILTIVSSWDAPDTGAEARRRLHAARDAGTKAILQDHTNWWEEYWLRGLASVADQGVERWYYTSLYLAASTLQAGKQSPGLQGLWVADNVAPWNADYHSNVNIQAVYWGLMTNNRLDMMEPYLRHYHSTADVARQDAATYFQMRGLRFPHGGSIGGHETTCPDYQTLGTDPCASSWITQLFWQYYEHSQDSDFLREVAYPLLRDVAMFYTDYLIRDEERQQWIIAPSVHFEARPTVFGTWGRNSLYAQAMFRGAFHRAIAAARVLGEDEELIEQWSERLENLAPLPVTEEGYWKAWEDREPYYGCHNYMLPIVFPAELVSRWHGPREWYDQARRTWKHLSESSDHCCTGEAWCGGQGICELMRIGEIEAAFEGARFPEESGSICRNGAIRNWVRGIFQADHGPGMCRVLADMCLLGLDGVIHLFAGIPKDVPARFHSLRAPGAFLISAEKRANEVDYVLVRSLAGGTLRIENPWPKCHIVVTPSEGDAFELKDCGILDIPTSGGVDYVVIPSGRNLDAIPLADFALQ